MSHPITTLATDSAHAARFFVTGGTVDLCDSMGNVYDTCGVLLSVWRSDGTTVCYVQPRSAH